MYLRQYSFVSTKYIPMLQETVERLIKCCSNVPRFTFISKISIFFCLYSSKILNKVSATLTAEYSFSPNSLTIFMLYFLPTFDANSSVVPMKLITP